MLAGARWTITGEKGTLNDATADGTREIGGFFDLDVKRTGPVDVIVPAIGAGWPKRSPHRRDSAYRGYVLYKARFATRRVTDLMVTTDNRTGEVVEITEGFTAANPVRLRPFAGDCLVPADTYED